MAAEAAEGLPAALGIDDPELRGRLLQHGHNAIVEEFLERVGGATTEGSAAFERLAKRGEGISRYGSVARSEGARN